MIAFHWAQWNVDADEVGRVVYKYDGGSRRPAVIRELTSCSNAARLQIYGARAQMKPHSPCSARPIDRDWVREAVQDEARAQRESRGFASRLIRVVPPRIVCMKPFFRLSNIKALGTTESAHQLVVVELPCRKEGPHSSEGLFPHSVTAVQTRSILVCFREALYDENLWHRCPCAAFDASFGCDSQVNLAAYCGVLTVCGAPAIPVFDGGI